MTLTRRQFAGLAVGTTVAVATGTMPALAGSKRTGSLSGRKGYNVKGSVTVKKSGSGTKVILGSDYLFDPTKNPPDIKIGFGNGETYAKGSKIHDLLTVKKGEATFTVPAGIDTSKYKELYIYCEKFTVILAVAPLS